MRSIIVTPTYNERENIQEFVERVLQHASAAHILIVDDSSPDGTGELADDLARLHADQIFVLHRPEKQGLGRAYVAGFRHVLERGYEVIAQMDADLSHDPLYLPAMFRKIQDCDLVLGSRYTRGINVVNWDLKRLILSKAANRYVQLVTGMAATDATGGFKCWRSETLRAIGLDSIFSNGYVFQVETTFRAMRLGFRIEEVPIIFYERNLGKSKMDIRIITEALWNVWKLRFRRHKRAR